MSGMDTEAFLGHETTGSRGAYLRGWTKRNSHSVDVWLHTKNSIWPLWRHPFQRLVSFKRDGVDGWEVWGDRLVCHEKEAVIKAQRRRDDETGERLVPPRDCGFCKMVEYVRDLIMRREISWVDPVFRFVGDDQTKATTLYAGGIVGMFGDRDLTDAHKRELKSHGIYQRDAWRQVCLPKAEYLFCVVDDTNPSAGVQKAIETSLLGDKVKVAIRQARTSLGEEDGDPLRSPWMMRWLYDAREGIEFQKKYDCIRMEKAQLREEIRELIVESPPPDVSEDVRRFDPRIVRKTMEEHAQMDLPWEEFFPGAGSTEEPEQERAPEVRGPAADEEVLACDECGHESPASATHCPKCGVEFEGAEVPEPPPPPPPPARVTRAEARRAREAVAAPPAARAPAPRQAPPPQAAPKAPPKQLPPAAAAPATRAGKPQPKPPISQEAKPQAAAKARPAQALPEPDPALDDEFNQDDIPF